MIKRQIRHLCVKENETVGDCYWKQMTVSNKALIVVDDNDKYAGIVCNSDFLQHKNLNPHAQISEIMNRNGVVIIEDSTADTYAEARNLFGEKNIGNIPVISAKGDVTDYFTRERSFYKQHYAEGLISHMHYAYNVMNAARLAEKLGCEGISVIEFGVAGGVGLLAAQFHAREIARMTGVDIRCYGFDLGNGLPQGDASLESENMASIFSQGSFRMDENKLRERLLDHTELVLGDIKDTIPTFFEQYHPYPVGAIFVDVDIYQSTKYILDWLEENPSGEKFLPRVYMYFDDISPQYERFGEDKAISEFNEKESNGMYISPEAMIDDVVYYEGEYTNWMNELGDWHKRRLKICHRTQDARYNKTALEWRDHIIHIENSVF